MLLLENVSRWKYQQLSKRNRYRSEPRIILEIGYVRLNYEMVTPLVDLFRLEWMCWFVKKIKIKKHYVIIISFFYTNWWWGPSALFKNIYVTVSYMYILTYVCVYVHPYVQTYWLNNFCFRYYGGNIKESLEKNKK